MPYLRRAAPEVVAAAASQRWDPAEVLRVLLAEEAAGRDRAMIQTRRRASLLAAGKTFDAWEADASSIPKAAQEALRTLEWIDRAENLCVAGPSGSGKSHFVELGPHAIDQGKTRRLAHHRVARPLLRRHCVDDSVSKSIGKLIRVELIIIDDAGLLAVAPDAAEALFRVVDAAYERRSIALTSNIHPAGFDELMPKTLAAATVDRLLHHAYVPAHRRPRKLPPHPSNRRQRSDAPDLRATPRSRLRCGLQPPLRRNHEPLVTGSFVATSGEKTWPPVGRTDGRTRGELDGPPAWGPACPWADPHYVSFAAGMR